MSTTSCNPKEPFIKLDDKGKASILNYNLPQSTCYRASSYLGLDLPKEFFEDKEPPRDNFWELAEKLTKEQWIGKLKDEMDLAIDKPIFDNPAILHKDNVRQFEEVKLNNAQVENFDSGNVSKSATLANEPTVSEARIANVPISSIADKIKKGFKPLLKEDLYGKVILDYLPRPVKVNPQIVIELRLKMCSYLGDYGAGRTVKTFSLLPGERTTISIRNWEHSEESRKQASNVLDSLSQSSANELQTIIESESTHTSGSSSSQTKDFGGGGGLNVGLDLGFLQIGGGGKVEGKKSKTFGSAVSDTVRNLVNSTSTHVSKTDSLRQIEINTETSSTNITENEETITRNLENINKSRVLNFVFRQLLQEFFTITYLDDISIVYSNGYPDSRKVTSLSGLDDFLDEVIPKEENRDKVKAIILNRLCSIYDYTGTRQQFIECVEEELACDLKCECLPKIEPEKYCYFRKKQYLKQTYKDKTVNGIILDTTHRIIRTSALVVDALLGQGEALDCYNQKLQDSATLNAELQNDKLKQALDAIENISDPEEKAKLYKKVFGDCCDVPQSGCNCNSENQ